MTKLQVDNYTFNFTNKTKSCFNFDGASHRASHFMKAVDIIAEYDDCWVYIEVKRFINPQTNKPVSPSKGNKPDSASKELTRELRDKYIDSWVYRTLENQGNKNIYYICVIEGLDKALLNTVDDLLKHRLPIKYPKCWKSPLITWSSVVDKDTWNKNFSAWATIT